MKVDAIEISIVKNGFVLKIYNFNHNEEAAMQVEIYTNLNDVVERAKQLFEVGDI